jgi:hypothetical protein
MGFDTVFADGISFALTNMESELVVGVTIDGDFLDDGFLLGFGLPDETLCRQVMEGVCPQWSL